MHNLQLQKFLQLLSNNPGVHLLDMEIQQVLVGTRMGDLVVLVVLEILKMDRHLDVVDQK